MLGTLGKWLRLLGYDTVIAGNDEPDARLVRVARAEGRVILTRDRELADRRVVQALLVVDDNLDAQLAQVARDLPLPPPQPGTRCRHCNDLLQPAALDEVAGDVPPYVLQTQPAFCRCPSCGRLYWRGTHWSAIEGKLAIMASALR